MMFQTEANYYETLEVQSDSSAQEIRNAYLRLKASYRKDNPALYSVLDPSETEDMIAKIEEAFQILSDPDSRREYDERNGYSERIERKIFSIDRTPPMEETRGDDPLVAPSTDFQGMSNRGENVSTGGNSFQLPTQAPATISAQPKQDNPFFDSLPKNENTSTFLVNSPVGKSESSFVDRRQIPTRREPERPILGNFHAPADPVLAEIANETEWRGSTLKRIRELRRYSLDDIAQITKISKTYLNAIEEELFEKLPAPVFVRGFLLQFSRTLKIPPEPVANAYMLRYQKRSGGI